MSSTFGFTHETGRFQAAAAQADPKIRGWAAQKGEGVADDDDLSNRKLRRGCYQNSLGGEATTRCCFLNDLWRLFVAGKKKAAAADWGSSVLVLVSFARSAT